MDEVINDRSLYNRTCSWRRSVGNWVTGMRGRYAFQRTHFYAFWNVRMLHMGVLSRSVVSDSLWPPWTVACQIPLSVEFSRQAYWSWLSFPTPGDLPNSGIEPMCPASAGGFFTTELPGKPRIYIYMCVCVCELSNQKRWIKYFCWSNMTCLACLRIV